MHVAWFASRAAFSLMYVWSCLCCIRALFALRTLSVLIWSSSLLLFCIFVPLLSCSFSCLRFWFAVCFGFLCSCLRARCLCYCVALVRVCVTLVSSGRLGAQTAGGHLYAAALCFRRVTYIGCLYYRCVCDRLQLLFVFSSFLVLCSWPGCCFGSFLFVSFFFFFFSLSLSLSFSLSLSLLLPQHVLSHSEGLTA